MPIVNSAPSAFTLTVPAGQNFSNSVAITFAIPAGVWLSATWVSQGSTTGVIDIQEATGDTWSFISARGMNGGYNFISGIFTSGAVLDAINAAAGGTLSCSVQDITGYTPTSSVVDNVSAYYLILDGGSSASNSSSRSGSSSSSGSSGSRSSSSGSVRSSSSATSGSGTSGGGGGGSGTSGGGGGGSGSATSGQSSGSGGSGSSGGSRASSGGSATSGSSVGASPPGDGPPSCDGLSLPLSTGPLMSLAGGGRGQAGEPDTGNAPLATGALRLGPEWGQYPGYGGSPADFGQPPPLCGPGDGGSCSVAVPL